MKKHAYLIIAHEDNLTLKALLKLLDDYRNDIYLHIDKKNKIANLEKIKGYINFSKIEIISEIDVYWGGYSLIKTELELLKLVKRSGIKYEYLHLLSGADLPLKSQDEIHEFFNKEKKEFISFASLEYSNQKKIRQRLMYFYMEKLMAVRERKTIKYVTFKIISKISILLQKIVRINRISTIKSIGYGANWFSITERLLDFIIENEKWIEEKFKKTYMGDECFLQTLLIEKYKNYEEIIYNLREADNGKAIRRYVDWRRGNPYIFKESDFNELVNSENFFARKFNDNVNKEIIKKLYKNIKNEELE